MSEPTDPMPLDEALRVAAWIVDKPYQDPTAGERAAVRLAAEVKRFRADGGHDHVYLSTSCWHDEHRRCSDDTATDTDGQSFRKQPARCKFCAAPCVCPCHQGDSP